MANIGSDRFVTDYRRGEQHSPVPFYGAGTTKLTYVIDRNDGEHYYIQGMVGTYGDEMCPTPGRILEAQWSGAAGIASVQSSLHYFIPPQQNP